MHAKKIAAIGWASPPQVGEESLLTWATGWAVFGKYQALWGDEEVAAGAESTAGVLALGGGIVHVGRWAGGCLNE